MVGRDSGRQRKAVDYTERGQEQASGGPAWLQSQHGKANSGDARQKENSKPAAPADKQPPVKPQRKSAPAAAAVAERGRNAGVTRLPIEDAKPTGKAAGSGKARSGRDQDAAPLPVAGGKPKQVPGLPGVVVKAALPAAVPEPAAAATKAGSNASGSRGSQAQAEADKAGAKSGSAGGKRKAAAALLDEAGPSGSGAKAPARSAPAAAAASDASKRSKAAPQEAPAPRQAKKRSSSQPDAAPAPMPAATAPAAAVEGEAGAPLVLPANGAEALVEQYSTNFRALQEEYDRLQQLYEDLKAAKIDEEVQQLLEQQNKYVTEHGQKAAQLVEHYKLEAEQQAALAAELGGGALVEQCNKLQADLLNCQQALLDQEVASLEKDKQIAAMQARLTYLERFARVYKTQDKCIQTDGPPLASASAQFPSLQSSGVEMLHAHALVPEGAVGGSIYKRPKTGGPAVPDPSYTLPELSPAPPRVAAAAQAGSPAAVVAARSPMAAAAAAAAAAPVSGSDMELTGEGAQQVQQAQQAAVLQLPQLAPQQQRAAAVARRHSMQPVSGRLAHAAAGPALRPASAESQVQVGAPSASQQQVPQQAKQKATRRGSVGVGRRVSAPPAPIDRELQFSSVSTAPVAMAGLAVLEAVPEEPQQQQPEPAPARPSPVASHRMQQAAAAAPVPQASVQTRGAPIAITAAAVAAAGAAPTPASVPAPPRDLAITALTGLQSTPLKGGAYQFCDPNTGYVFQLGPASPDSADLSGDEEEPELCYRPIQLGRAAELLPEYLRTEIKFMESQRANLIQIMMDALVRHRQQR